MWKWRLSDESGARLRVYEVVENASSLGLVTEERALYFGGRRVWTDRTPYSVNDEEEEFADRLGSVVWREGTRLSYYPYGEEKGTTTEQGRDKFGTYLRDEVTGLDYAVNRYYGSGLGRFLSADPYDGSGAVKSPQSWNRYGYVKGDPVNFGDPSGLDRDSFQRFAACISAPYGGTWSWLCAKAKRGSARPPRPIQEQLDIEARRSIDFFRTNTRLHAQLGEGLMELPSPCYDAFNARGKSSGDLASVAASINFYDATTSLGSLTQNDVVGNGVFERLNSQSLAYYGNNAHVLLDRDGVPTASVVIRANFYGGKEQRSRTAQNRTLVHESLHVAFRMGDEELRGHLGVPSRFGEDNSAAIGDWLEAGCPPE